MYSPNRARDLLFWWDSFARKPVVLIRTQEVKLHKNFVHFKYSSSEQGNILGEYSSFFKAKDVKLPNKLVSKRLESKRPATI